VLTTFGIATQSFVAVLRALGIAIGRPSGHAQQSCRRFMLSCSAHSMSAIASKTERRLRLVQMINLFYTEIESDDKARIVIPTASCGRDRSRAW